VFEIGPGSGHLRAYLLNLGHRLIAMGVTQSLYLWQNRLFVHTSSDLDEWATGDVQTVPALRAPRHTRRTFHGGTLRISTNPCQLLQTS
jgi:hypothetical protein